MLRSTQGCELERSGVSVSEGKVAVSLGTGVWAL